MRCDEMVCCRKSLQNGLQKGPGLGVTRPETVGIASCTCTNMVGWVGELVLIDATGSGPVPEESQVAGKPDRLQESAVDVRKTKLQG